VPRVGEFHLIVFGSEVLFWPFEPQSAAEVFLEG
jgi:hypothetical protein